MPPRLWLCLPPALFAFLDYVVTMANQPPQYWTGDYDAALEGNPVVRWCMIAHPALFHGLTIVWLATFTGFILKTPRFLARFASFAITFSHALFTGTWMYETPDGFNRALALCVACAIVLVMALELSEDPPLAA